MEGEALPLVACAAPSVILSFGSGGFSRTMIKETFAPRRMALAAALADMVLTVVRECIAVKRATTHCITAWGSVGSLYAYAGVRVWDFPPL